MLELRTEHHDALKADITVLSKRVRKKIADVKFGSRKVHAGKYTKQIKNSFSKI
jgi:hypothetical protein